jgi:hypothetical protein
MCGKAERLTKRDKPMRPKLKRLHERPIIIDANTGPVQISAEQQGGRLVVKVESICPEGCQCGGAQCQINLTADHPKA